MDTCKFDKLVNGAIELFDGYTAEEILSAWATVLEVVCDETEISMLSILNAMTEAITRRDVPETEH